MVWKEKIQLLLAAGPASKDVYLKSVLKQIESNSEVYPTRGQLPLLEKFWKSYQKKQLEKLFGDDDYERFL